MLSVLDNEYLKEQYKKIVEGCPLCHGRKPYCECKYAFQFEYAKIKANIPIALRGFTIDDFTHPQLQKEKKAVIEYAEQLNKPYNNGNLYLCGDKGTGKSAVAAWILEEALKHKKSGYFFHTLYSAKVAATKVWDRVAKDDEDCTALTKYDIIVIDKIGEGTTIIGQTFEELKEILRARTESGKITILVGTVPAKNLVSNEAELLNVCSCEELQFSGFDYKKAVLKAVQDNPKKKQELPDVVVKKRRSRK